MSRRPLSGLARPSRLAAVAASAAILASGAVAVPADSADARTRRATSFASYVQRTRTAAMACELSEGPGTQGLKPWPAAVRARIAAEFGLTDIGGYRPGRGKSDHHRGQALDIMVRGQRGDRIADWVRDHADELNVKYVIWEQGYWQPGMSRFRRMEDRGSVTANHYDHVHVSFRSGSGSCPA